MSGEDSLILNASPIKYFVLCWIITHVYLLRRIFKRSHLEFFSHTLLLHFSAHLALIRLCKIILSSWNISPVNSMQRNRTWTVALVFTLISSHRLFQLPSWLTSFFKILKQKIIIILNVFYPKLPGSLLLTEWNLDLKVQPDLHL